MANVRLAFARMTVAPTPTLPRSDSSKTRVSLPYLGDDEEGRGTREERERGEKMKKGRGHKRGKIKGWKDEGKERREEKSGS